MPPAAPLTERFWRYVNWSSDAACWTWTGIRHHGGYGLIHSGGRGGRNLMAHRVAYEMFIGPIPAGLQLDHLCRVRDCVNPAHLEPVTQLVNVRRGVGASVVNSTKTHCPAGHPYDKANTYLTPRGARQCRACGRIRHHHARKGNI